MGVLVNFFIPQVVVHENGEKLSPSGENFHIPSLSKEWEALFLRVSPGKFSPPRGRSREDRKIKPLGK